MKTIKILIITVLISFAFFSQQRVQATSLSIDPSSITVGFGDIFLLDIGVVADEPVNWAVMYLTFDSSILDIIGATEGDFLTTNGTCPESPCSTGFDWLSDPGEVIIANYFTSDSSYAIGSGILATLEFEAVGLGTSPVSFELVTTLFGPGPDYNGITDVVQTGGTVNVVPEPSTLLLVSSGLIAALGARRFKKNV